MKKIRYYLGDQHENSKVPIIKSLNDLLGFRIFVQDVDLVHDELKNDINIKVHIDRMYMERKMDILDYIYILKIITINSFHWN